MPLTVHHKVPSVQTYLGLRKAGGMGSYSEEAARIGLANSMFSVVLELDGEPIGMGRLVGDGGCFVQVTDIVVDPEHHGKGHGRQIMDELIAYLKANVPETAYISLLADVPANRLYEKYGFRETAPATVGMAMRNSRD